MLFSAAYEAGKDQAGAAAPADVGGMAAVYFEAGYPGGFDQGDLVAGRRGVPEPEFCGGRCPEQVELD